MRSDYSIGVGGGTKVLVLAANFDLESKEDRFFSLASF